MTENFDKLVIDEAQYRNLFGMLNSSEEDQMVALQCLKSLSKQRNHVAIAFLRKNCKCDIRLWEAICKTHMRYQLTLGIPEFKITFAQIHKAIQNEPQYKEENGKFFTARYVDFLRESLAKMGYIESVEINVKIKDYE